MGNISEILDPDNPIWFNEGVSYTADGSIVHNSWLEKEEEEE